MNYKNTLKLGGLTGGIVTLVYGLGIGLGVALERQRQENLHPVMSDADNYVRIHKDQLHDAACLLLNNPEDQAVENDVAAWLLDAIEGKV